MSQFHVTDVRYKTERVAAVAKPQHSASYSDCLIKVLLGSTIKNRRELFHHICGIYMQYHIAVWFISFEPLDTVYLATFLLRSDLI